MARIARLFPRFALIASVAVLGCGGEDSEESGSGNPETDSGASSPTGSGGSGASTDASPDSSSGSGTGGTGNSEEDSGSYGGSTSIGGSGGAAASADAATPVDAGPRLGKDVLCDEGCGSMSDAGCERTPTAEECELDCEGNLNPPIATVDCSYQWDLAMQCVAFATVTCDDTGRPTSETCDPLIDDFRLCFTQE